MMSDVLAGARAAGLGRYCFLYHLLFYLLHRSQTDFRHNQIRVVKNGNIFVQRYVFDAYCLI